jgi:hypothetical protein
MTTYYGVYADYRDVDVPPTKIPPGDAGGKVISAYDYFAFTADLVGGTDTIKMMKIPAGARVVDVKAVFTDLDGSGGTLNIGWAAGATAAEAADADGFMAGVDVTSAGSISMFEDQSSRPGMFKKFTEEVQVVIAVDGDTDASSGTIYLNVQYVID